MILHLRRERVADGVVHLLGLVAVLAGCLILAGHIARPTPPRALLAVGLYAIGLVATFGCSAAYNMAPDGRWKRVLRRFDHAAIFLMIAGTYSPVGLLAMGGRWGMALFAGVWAVALLGALVKLLAPGRFERSAIAAYLLLGWIGLSALPRLLDALPAWQLGALALGGALYSIGVVAHLSPRLPYRDAIWHTLVLIAAACHYAVVLRLAMG